MGHLKVLNDTKLIKGVTHAHLGPIWYHSEPSDMTYSPNQFLGWDFFDASYSKTALVVVFRASKVNTIDNFCWFLEWFLNDTFQSYFFLTQQALNWSTFDIIRFLNQVKY